MPQGDNYLFYLVVITISHLIITADVKLNVKVVLDFHLSIHQSLKLVKSILKFKNH